MKTSNFGLMAVIFAAVLMGCTNNGKQPEVKQTIEVKAKAPASDTQTSTVVFSGDEIVSYNGKTGEIVFANTPKGKAYEILSHYNNGDLEFYLGSELLFKLNCRVSDIQSNIVNEPLLRFESNYNDNSGGSNDDDTPNDSASQQQMPRYTAADAGNDGTPKWFIEDGYPMGKTINGKRGNASGIDEKERDENAKKIMAGFLRFIEALKAEGKYIER